LAHLSLRNRSLATSACSALLALLATACGAGDDGPATSTAAVSPFDGPASSANNQQTPSNTQSPPGSTPGDTSNPSPTGSTNPETQPGGITLTPGGTNPGGTDPTGMNPTGMNPTGMNPTGMDPTGMNPPLVPAEFPDAVLERPSRGTPNLFTDLLGIPEPQVNGKLVQAVSRFFGIGTNEPATPTRDTGWRVYYELPQDRSMAFIWTTDSNDIRSEGMSYGMMIALQMDLQPQFNALWKFAQTFMQYPANAAQTSWRGNFRWQGSVNTANANNWQINFPLTNGPAPDGDEYFAAALYLADRRWGSNGGVNYQQQAETITRAMLSNPAANNNTPLINAANNLVVFFPNTQNQFTDPSYNLPAFYELYALDGPAGDAARWNTIADASRRLLVNSANGNTGLHPDYSNFNGTPNAGGSNHDQFRFDAWRVPMNMAMDFAWFGGQDARHTTQVNKYHAFFANQLNDNKDNVRNATFAIDGSNAGGGSSTALTSVLGAGAIASTAPNRTDFVQAAWDVYQQSGQYRYYQECVYLLGLLHTAGVFGYEWNAQ
jgi:oligosaccharide reducing-end xylanase